MRWQRMPLLMIRIGLCINGSQWEWKWSIVGGDSLNLKFKGDNRFSAETDLPLLSAPRPPRHLLLKSCHWCRHWEGDITSRISFWQIVTFWHWSQVTLPPWNQVRYQDQNKNWSFLFLKVCDGSNALPKGLRSLQVSWCYSENPIQYLILPFLHPFLLSWSMTPASNFQLEGTGITSTSILLLLEYLPR